jgi:predicted metal-dependent peptidase
MEKQEARLKKSHVFLLKHPKVHQLGGIILMGTNEVVKGIPTAYTDGVNKRYGEEFLAKLKDEEINGLVLHENCHIFYRHVTHHKTTFKENAKLANIAADFVVNDMIVEMKDAKIVLPEGGLYNPMFHNWSMSKVYAYLKQRKKELDEEGQGQGQGQGGQPQDNNSPGGETLNDRHDVTDIDKLLKNLNDHDSLDEHDYKAAEKYDEKEISEKVDRALREGGLLAGILGGDKNRQIEQLLEPKVDWREALREFVMAQCAGRSDYRFLSATRSCPRKYASCGGTPKSMANKSFKTTTQVLLTCSSPWVVGELRFHVSVNT